MIVVDANVIAYLLIAGEKTAQAQAAWQRDPQWIVPSLWRHEVLNILATYTRNGGMTLPAALQIWQHAVELLSSAEQDPPPGRALSLATEQRISAYDAQYVVLAMENHLWLLSEDRTLQRKFPSLVRSLANYSG